jgi:hypothetical protein
MKTIFTALASGNSRQIAKSISGDQVTGTLVKKIGSGFHLVMSGPLAVVSIGEAIGIMSLKNEVLSSHQSPLMTTVTFTTRIATAPTTALTQVRTFSFTSFSGTTATNTISAITTRIQSTTTTTILG